MRPGLVWLHLFALTIWAALDGTLVCLMVVRAVVGASEHRAVDELTSTVAFWFLAPAALVALFTGATGQDRWTYAVGLTSVGILGLTFSTSWVFRAVALVALIPATVLAAQVPRRRKTVGRHRAVTSDVRAPGR